MGSIMIGFIREMLRTPEAQKDPHYWASVFGAHCWLALGPWGAAAIIFDRWTAVWVVSISYLILWEGAQLLLAKRRTLALYGDSILDACAVALACCCAALYGEGNLMGALATWCGTVLVKAIGTRTRL